MGYLMGTDEAGYGPNLGPLVISATLWETPDGVGGEELYRRLEAAISPRPRRADGNGPAPLCIGDSKALYQSGKGLRLLERGLWAAFALLQRSPRTETEVWDLFGARRRRGPCDRGGLRPATKRRCPWRPTPRKCNRESPRSARRWPRRGCGWSTCKAGRSFPAASTSWFGKPARRGPCFLARRSTWRRRSTRALPDGPIAILCDKHGGRDRYLPLLAESFSTPLVEVVVEGRQESAYRFGPAERRVEIRFVAKGESHLPAALASMASKYLRELAMRSLNAFWRRHAPHAAPTAGYPQDAVRFKREIAEAQARLGIDDHWIWRTK